ncbi:MAG: 50S ribosomal protein L17 [Candidatus Omnitrophica bacterium]|nr:50S ribosomal protein L17 [Candidatus Omnitrophota bacterium]
MRHNVRRTRLNKMDSHRKALLTLLVKHLIMHQRIKTTWARAKEAQRLGEQLITQAKKNTLNARRAVAGRLQDKDAVIRLFKEIAPLFKDRAGGYTRIIPFNRRRGDGAELVFLELVEKVKEEKKEKKAKAKTSAKTVPGKTPLDAAQKPAEPQKEVHKSAPEVKPEVKEERVIEDVKREKARREETKFIEKEKPGFLRKFFRRKQGM